MIFRSKIDRFFVILMGMVTLILASVTILPLLIEDDWQKDIAGIMILLSLFISVTGFLIWTSLSVQYIFKPDHLFIKGGPFRSRIPYDKIKKVAPTRDILTGYRILSSRDAIELTNQTTVFGSIKISPRNQEAFIRELVKRNPTITIQK